MPWHAGKGYRCTTCHHTASHAEIIHLLHRITRSASYVTYDMCPDMQVGATVATYWLVVVKSRMQAMGKNTPAEMRYKGGGMAERVDTRRLSAHSHALLSTQPLKMLYAAH